MATVAASGGRGVAQALEMAFNELVGNDDGVYENPALGEIRHYALPEEFRERLFSYAAKHKTSISRVVETSIAKWLDNGGKLAEKDRQKYFKRVASIPSD
jgi:hypothetical protein